MKTLTVMLQKTVATPDHNVRLTIERTPATAAGVRGGNPHIASRANCFKEDRGKEGQGEERVGECYVNLLADVFRYERTAFWTQCHEASQIDSC